MTDNFNNENENSLESTLKNENVNEENMPRNNEISQNENVNEENITRNNEFSQNENINEENITRNNEISQNENVNGENTAENLNPQNNFNNKGISPNSAIYTTSTNNTAQLDNSTYGKSIYKQEPPQTNYTQPPREFVNQAPPQTSQNTDPTSFYHETIKNTHYNYKKNKQNSKFKRTVAAAVAVAICGGASIGIGLGLSTPIANAFFPEFTQLGETNQIPETKNDFSFSQSASPVVNTPSQTAEEKINEEANVLDAMSNLLVNVVNKVEPSVVNITSIVVDNDNFFNIPVEGESLGSGIIFNQDGNTVYIVTNYHVIGGASEVRILVSGAEELVNAKLVGRQPESDLAVISVSMEDLRTVGVENVTVAKFGDSTSMQIGEMVLAIGNMLGEGNTATIGVVSAMDKTITVDGKTLEVMQTDAVINPGNSGGALVNLQGEVIGINTAKLATYSSQEAIDGIGYSIPTEVAIPIIENLRNGVAQAYMGVEGMTIDEQTASMYNIPSIGVLVRSTTPDSSAEKAGILAGDIITGFNGNSVFQWEDLSNGIKSLSPGDVVEVKLIRNSQLVTLSVTLGEYNDGF